MNTQKSHCMPQLLHALLPQIKIVCPTFLPSDREYLCLGEWEEDGLLYTYTRRTHNPRHECFVGRVTSHPPRIHLIQPSSPGRERGKDITCRRWSQLSQGAESGHVWDGAVQTRSLDLSASFQKQTFTIQEAAGKLTS